MFGTGSSVGAGVTILAQVTLEIRGHEPDPDQRIKSQGIAHRSQTQLTTADDLYGVTPCGQLFFGGKIYIQQQVVMELMPPSHGEWVLFDPVHQGLCLRSKRGRAYHAQQ